MWPCNHSVGVLNCIQITVFHVGGGAEQLSAVIHSQESVDNVTFLSKHFKHSDKLQCNEIDYKNLLIFENLRLSGFIIVSQV